MALLYLFSRDYLCELFPKSSDSSSDEDQTSTNIGCGPTYPSATGLTFFFWIYFDNMSSSRSTLSNPHRSCLLRMLSVAGNGLEVFLSSKSELVVATAQSGAYHYATVSDIVS